MIGFDSFFFCVTFIGIFFAVRVFHVFLCMSYFEKNIIPAFQTITEYKRKINTGILILVLKSVARFLH